MSTTVVDRLIVTLGLDPRDFKKGAKEAAAAEVDLAAKTKRATTEMSNDFMVAAKKFLGVASVVVALRKLVGVLADVSTETRRLGIDSENFQYAAHKMRNFQNAVELMGGKAEDATATIGGLQKAVYDLTVLGQSSASLEMLTRLGVAFQDNTGHARDFLDVVKDTADALERAQKNGTLNRSEAFFTAKQAGFDDGTARLILSGRANIDKLLADRAGLHQVNDQDLAGAETIERDRARVNQWATSKGVQAIGVSGVALDDVSTMYEKTITKTADAMEGLENAVRGATKALTIGGMTAAADGRMTAADRQKKYQPAIDAAAKRYGINPAMLTSLLKTESNFNSGAVSGAGAVGIAQLMPQYFPGAGKSPWDDINTAAKHLRKLHDSFVKSGDADDTGAWFLATQAYNAGETRIRNNRAGKGGPLADETLKYTGKVLGAAGAAVPTPGVAGSRASGSTTVNVGPVTVNSAATDAEGVARDMNGAVRRKMNVAQAEPGMN